MEPTIAADWMVWLSNLSGNKGFPVCQKPVQRGIFAHPVSLTGYRSLSLGSSGEDVT